MREGTWISRIALFTTLCGCRRGLATNRFASWAPNPEAEALEEQYKRYEEELYRIEMNQYDSELRSVHIPIGI